MAEPVAAGAGMDGPYSWLSPGECSSSNLPSSANHSDSSGLARSLALSFSRVAAARRILVLPDALQRNSGFLARARHARGNDRNIRPTGRAVSLSCAGFNKLDIFDFIKSASDNLDCVKIEQGNIVTFAKGTSVRNPVELMCPEQLCDNLGRSVI